jgi:hypothetical protein
MAWSFIIPVLPPAEIRRAYFPATGLMVLISPCLVFDLLASAPGIQLEKWLA